LQVRLVERIKRASFWEPGAARTVTTYGTTELPPIDGTADVRPGERLIILFGRNTLDPGVQTIPCGVVPYTAENLAVVRRGTAQDERVPPLVEYQNGFQPGKLSDVPKLPPAPRKYLLSQWDE
jgi:hypothetical protein